MVVSDIDECLVTMHWLPTLLVSTSARDMDIGHRAFVRGESAFFCFANDASSGYRSDVEIYRGWLTLDDIKESRRNGSGWALLALAQSRCRLTNQIPSD